MNSLPVDTVNTPEVIVYGTVCLDRFVAVDAAGEPLPESADAPVEMPGGEAFNTATALAGWRVRVLLTGTAIGSEPEGNRLRDLLDTHPLADGLPRRFIPHDSSATTPVCTVRVFPDGERQMSGKGFAHAVAPPPLPPLLFRSRPLYVCDPNLGPSAVEAAVAAHDAGCRILAMDFAREKEVVRRSRILVTSVEMLQRQGETASPETVVRRLVEEGGAETAIVTQGREGCVVFDRREGILRQPAVKVDDVVDTTGAGDVFRAGLVWGLLRSLSLSDIVRFATAAAAEHCRVWGGGSRPSLSNVLILAMRLHRKNHSIYEA